MTPETEKWVMELNKPQDLKDIQAMCARIDEEKLTDVISENIMEKEKDP